jgi:hypothetical protein
MQKRLSDEPPKKTSITIVYDVQDPFSFSAPPFTAKRKHARVYSLLPDDTAACERFIRLYSHGIFSLFHYVQYDVMFNEDSQDEIEGTSRQQNRIRPR